MLKKAYRVVGDKCLLDNIPEDKRTDNIRSLINILYEIDECFRLYRSAVKFAKRMTEELNKDYGFNFTVYDYFGDLKDYGNNGFVYNTETNDFEWLEE